MPQSPDERIIRRFLELKERATALSSAASGEAYKHGKFVYRYEGGRMNVYRKYEAGKKVFKVLYSGPL
jgi:hypothetical protein